MIKTVSFINKAKFERNLIWATKLDKPLSMFLSFNRAREIRGNDGQFITLNGFGLLFMFMQLKNKY